ncbi:MAG: hypothetical protein IPJ78_00955 [Gemmatimonadetes bacterium]|nr:hypothetical protein [Gemmatimonadota bacterium]
MKEIQKQLIESFVRVRSFLEAHPVSGPLSYAGVRETLDDVVRRLREHAGAQLTGRDLSRNEVQRQRQMVRDLVDRHMRPIVAIAQSQVDTGSSVLLPAALRLPRLNRGITRILQECDGMIEAVRPFEATFIAEGLPADFLARFAAARNALEAVLGGRQLQVGVHVGARAGLAVQARRGRAAVRRLDSIVRASFTDEMTLAAWRSAKRVQRSRGGAAGRTTDEEEPMPALERAA